MMTPFEAIPKISELMIALIERSKDAKTSALVSQIQSLNQTVQAGYFSAEQKATKLASDNFDMKQSHSKEISELRSEITNLNKQINDFKTPKRTQKLKFVNDQPEANYGVPS